MIKTKKVSFEVIKKPSCRMAFLGARNRNRTGTGITSHGILSPGRLPVPPLEHYPISIAPFFWFVKKKNNYFIILFAIFLLSSNLAQFFLSLGLILSLTIMNISFSFPAISLKIELFFKLAAYVAPA